MKTYTEYEATDIDIKADPPDPVISFLFGELVVIGLTGFKPRPDDPTSTFFINRMIANFLNDAQKAGIVITKAELPAAFGSR